jgi:hypothetical protein
MVGPRRAEGGDRKRHRQPVIVLACTVPPVRRPLKRTWKPSGRSSASAPIARQTGHEFGDAIAFLDPQFSGPRNGDAAAKGCRAWRARAIRRSLRHFIRGDDEVRHPAMADAETADRLTVPILLNARLDIGAKAPQHVEQCRAAWVEPT